MALFPGCRNSYSTWKGYRLIVQGYPGHFLIPVICLSRPPRQWLVLYDGCEQVYERVIQSIFDIVAPTDVIWVSIGTFRFMPQLKPIVEKRFPDSTIPYGEFILSLDNKMRY